MNQEKTMTVCGNWRDFEGGVFELYAVPGYWNTQADFVLHYTIPVDWEDVLASLDEWVELVCDAPTSRERYNYSVTIQGV